MRRLIAVCAVVLAACATVAMPPGVNGKLRAGYDATRVYADATAQALTRGRIDVPQAEQAQGRANEALDKIGTIQDSIAACAAPADCSDLMGQVQPLLLQMEADLRAQQKRERSADRSLLGVITVINDATMLIGAGQALAASVQGGATDADVTKARASAKSAVDSLGLLIVVKR